mgnify:CR=1 FL=1
MKINYYLTFEGENKISMNLYGRQLVSYQKDNFKDSEINYYLPKLSLLSKFFFSNIWKLRYSRYISYPHQIKKLSKCDIAHICDHQYAHLYPYLNSKLKFITVHDLVPIIFQKKLNKNPLLFKYSLSKLKYFTKVLAVSNNTKKDILKYTDCPEDKIEVIMECIESIFNDNLIEHQNVLKKYKIPFNKKKVLITGNIFYKNHETSYKILEKLYEINKEIIFIHMGNGNKKINLSEKIRNNVFTLPFVNREEVPDIYKISDVLLFPSIYEGFGRPILEAMSCGTPVVCSNNSSITEVAGDAALTCDYNDIKTFTNNILKLLSNKQLQQKKINQGIIQSKLFSINKFHNNLMQIYKNELGKRKY